MAVNIQRRSWLDYQDLVHSSRLLVTCQLKCQMQKDYYKFYLPVKSLFSQALHQQSDIHLVFLWRISHGLSLNNMDCPWMWPHLCCAEFTNVSQFIPFVQCRVRAHPCLVVHEIDTFIMTWFKGFQSKCCCRNYLNSRNVNMVPNKTIKYHINQKI